MKQIFIVNGTIFTDMKQLSRKKHIDYNQITYVFITKRNKIKRLIKFAEKLARKHETDNNRDAKTLSELINKIKGLKDYLLSLNIVTFTNKRKKQITVERITKSRLIEIVEAIETIRDYSDTKTIINVLKTYLKK